MLFFQSCKLGSIVDSEKSNNHYYSRNKKSVIWSPNGNWFELGYNKLEGVDVESFSVLSEHWSKDKNKVYHQYISVPQIDVNTFHVISGDKGHDINHVYFVQDPYPGTIQIIEGADPETYEILSSMQLADVLWGYRNKVWAKDKNHIFLNDTIYESADAATFEVLSGRFSKDKTNLYVLLGDESLERVAVIPVNTCELRLLPENSEYIRTDNSLFVCKYLYSENKYKVVEIALSLTDTIEYINEAFLRIKDIIYEYGEPITYLEKAIDSKTFKSLDTNKVGLPFFADKEQVYFYNQLLEVLPGANPETIRYIGGLYLTDGNHVYWCSSILKEANPETFYYDEEQARGIDGDEQFLRGKSLKKWKFEGGEWKKIDNTNTK